MIEDGMMTWNTICHQFAPLACRASIKSFVPLLVNSEHLLVSFLLLLVNSKQLLVSFVPLLVNSEHLLVNSSDIWNGSFYITYVKQSLR
ncbi:hypothetical protein ACFX4I_09175 [Peribacillus sp. YIM B13472]|uniref:hypothetical protein n=1 Tax=Peribacillus TaxID=2675229 RepID=UPI00366B9FA0